MWQDGLEGSKSEKQAIEKHAEQVSYDIDGAGILHYTKEGERLYNAASRSYDDMTGKVSLYVQNGNFMPIEEAQERLLAIENYLNAALRETAVKGLWQAAGDYMWAMGRRGYYPVLICDTAAGEVYCKTMQDSAWIEGLPAWKVRLDIADQLLRFAWQSRLPLSDVEQADIAGMIQCEAEPLIDGAQAATPRTVREIAERCGVSMQTIRNRAKRCGIELKRGVPLTDEQVVMLLTEQSLRRAELIAN